MITNNTNRFWFVLLSVFTFVFRNKSLRKWFWVPFVVLGVGSLLPQNMVIPVQDATIKSWNAKSFRAYPWGTSITHKDIDVFAEKGTDVVASTNGIVIYTY